MPLQQMIDMTDVKELPENKLSHFQIGRVFLLCIHSNGIFF
ncbi:hypothetical protein FDUTEX481_01279 [Tolypothrix sp. PCC 7601]|nr:hypothetical protein FDUTEX481_01279 [Tolypothrix sp. PCC 7601]